MAAASENNRERCDDLLVQFALHGLESHEQGEMNELIRELNVPDSDRFERTVGALDSVLDQNPGEELPDGLRSSLILGAINHFDQADGKINAATTPTSPNEKSNWTRREVFLGVATAASLLFALASLANWFGRPVENVAQSASQSQSSQEKLDQLRQAGLNDLRIANWTNPTDDEASSNASGQVIWSDAKQEGYMVFSGLQANDPATSQYQLWIFDKARDEALPVDGGVFNIVGSGKEVVVPVNAKLSITEATMFAVTIEKPGGVVQSKRERLPLLAKVEL